VQAVGKQRPVLLCFSREKPGEAARLWWTDTRGVWERGRVPEAVDDAAGVAEGGRDIEVAG
jgi:hypothetical protein